MSKSMKCRLKRPLSPIKKLVNNWLKPTPQPAPKHRLQASTPSIGPLHHSDAFQRIGLQTVDAESDAIVITVLDTIPFCCHEDLVYMSRAGLVKVALTLNSKLPATFQIDINPARSDVFIRNSIEFFVGLRGSAPKATLGRSQSQPTGIRRPIGENDTTLPNVQHPASACLDVRPLLRSRKRRHSNGFRSVIRNRPLARLDEELEDETTSIARPFKKRRVSVDLDLGMQSNPGLSP